MATVNPQQRCGPENHARPLSEIKGGMGRREALLSLGTAAAIIASCSDTVRDYAGQVLANLSLPETEKAKRMDRLQAIEGEVAQALEAQASTKELLALLNELDHNVKFHPTSREDDVTVAQGAQYAMMSAILNELSRRKEGDKHIDRAGGMATSALNTLNTAAERGHTPYIPSVITVKKLEELAEAFRIRQAEKFAQRQE